MSAPLQPDAILFLQRCYACAGFYSGKLDSEYGPQTDAAAKAWEAKFQALKAQYGALDPRSEGELYTILPQAQALARQSIKKLLAAGLDARITSGSRSYPEQAALFAQGRTEPGDIVTHARPGQSLHNFGIAWDTSLFENGKYLTDSPLYAKIGEIGVLPSLVWGGSWSPEKVDMPHLQLNVGLSLAEMRANFEAGKGFTVVIT